MFKTSPYPLSHLLDAAPGKNLPVSLNDVWNNGFCAAVDKFLQRQFQTAPQLSSCYLAYADNLELYVFHNNLADSADIMEPPALHLDYFLNNKPQKLMPCPEKCCLALPLGKKAFLLLCAARPLDASTQALAGLILQSAACELKNQIKIQQLRKQVEFGEKIVHSMSHGFLVLAPDLTVINANQAACALLNTTAQALIGSTLANFVFSPLLVQQVFKTGEAVKDREVFIKLADRDVHIIKTAVPVFGHDGSVISVLDHFREIKETRRLAGRIAGAKAGFTFDDIIHKSQIMREVIELSKLAAANSLSVLITGESGTGKEMFAHAVHLAGARRNAPFVVIDCASLPRDLVASELFGYVDGAFTGARRGGSPGKFELADGGTIFLDELGELPLEVQPQFLRVLQTRQVMRLGGKEGLPVDIRVIAATNCDLADAVRRGNFREDLFFRLNVLNIHIPALRFRKDDIIELAHFLLKKYCQVTGKEKILFSDSALEKLMTYSWPGNVRELENTIAKAVHICNGIIEEKHLCLAVYPVTKPVLTMPDMQEPALHEAIYTPPLKDVETQAIRHALKICSGNISKAAKMLGLARSTIYKKMSAWN
ncbi:MAG: sigma 54-interacting transcriptional regulator [Desulfovibrio sp.]|jgi:transcriptional regulator with PAS, ATPase and Fis domain|nr:sigma 54-interacting transcriptional regulator [Desulfovibrio sp.]